MRFSVRVLWVWWCRATVAQPAVQLCSLRTVTTVSCPFFSYWYSLTFQSFAFLVDSTYFLPLAFSRLFKILFYLCIFEFCQQLNKLLISLVQLVIILEFEVVLPTWLQPPLPNISLTNFRPGLLQPHEPRAKPTSKTQNATKLTMAQPTML